MHVSFILEIFQKLLFIKCHENSVLCIIILKFLLDWDHVNMLDKSDLSSICSKPYIRILLTVQNKSV